MANAFEDELNLALRVHEDDQPLGLHLRCEMPIQRDRHTDRTTSSLASVLSRFASVPSMYHPSSTCAWL